jgi:hypothetical protein
MQRVAPASAAVLAAAFLLLHSSGAWGAELTSAAGCGTSTQEAIASAQKALSNKSPDEQRVAIACLIRALTAVDAVNLTGGMEAWAQSGRSIVGPDGTIGMII